MISYSKKESVASLTLNRADTDNRINTQIAADLKDIRSVIQDDKDIRVVIITGEGNETFCAGTDLEEADSLRDNANFTELLAVAATIDEIECPVIAAINGAAYGQGLELALACDLRICSQNATFGMPQAACGQMPWDGGSQRLTRLVGKGKALEMILYGENMDAQEALRIGLVHNIVPSDELMAVVQKIAYKIAAQSPVALAYTKEAINKGTDLTLAQGLRLEADLYYLIHTTHDRTEGVTAFREKRRAHFEGK